MEDHRKKARSVAYVLLIIVLIHTGIIALWSGPSNPIKQAIGAGNIRQYVNPIFEQNWQIFAPTPKRVTSELDFRAQIKNPDTGEIFDTDWHALVASENEMIRHNPSPPRTAFAARRTALSLHNAADDMNEEQRIVIEQDFHTPQASALGPELKEAPTESGATNSQINTYLKYDSMATYLATLSAAVLYDGEIIAVQYRTGKAGVPRFEERDSRTLADVERARHDFGWRPAPSVSDVEVSRFAPYAKNIPLAGEQPS